MNKFRKLIRFISPTVRRAEDYIIDRTQVSYAQSDGYAKVYVDAQQENMLAMLKNELGRDPKELDILNIMGIICGSQNRDDDIAYFMAATSTTHCDEVIEQCNERFAFEDHVLKNSTPITIGTITGENKFDLPLRFKGGKKLFPKAKSDDYWYAKKLIEHARQDGTLPDPYPKTPEPTTMAQKLQREPCNW